MSEQAKQALVTSLRLLSATPKSRKLLETKLSERGFDSDVIRKTVEALERQGLLSDRALGESLLENFKNYRLSGKKRIAFEMKKRGIASPLIQELVAKYGPEEEREKATQLAREKWEKLKKLASQKRRKRVYDFLLRRGFDYSLSRDVVETLDREKEE